MRRSREVMTITLLLICVLPYLYGALPIPNVSAYVKGDPSQVSACDSLVDWSAADVDLALDTADKQEGTSSINATYDEIVSRAVYFNETGVWDWTLYFSVTFWFKTNDTTAISSIYLYLYDDVNASNWLRFNIFQYGTNFHDIENNTWKEIVFDFLLYDNFSYEPHDVDISRIDAMKFVTNNYGPAYNVVLKLDDIRVLKYESLRIIEQPLFLDNSTLSGSSISKCYSLDDWTFASGGTLEVELKSFGDLASINYTIASSVSKWIQYTPTGTWDFTEYDQISFWFKTSNITEPRTVYLWLKDDEGDSFRFFIKYYSSNPYGLEKDVWKHLTFVFDEYDDISGTPDLSKIDAVFLGFMSSGVDYEITYHIHNIMVEQTSTENSLSSMKFKIITLLDVLGAIDASPVPPELNFTVAFNGTDLVTHSVSYHITSIGTYWNITFNTNPSLIGAGWHNLTLTCEITELPSMEDYTKALIYLPSDTHSFSFAFVTDEHFASPWSVGLEHWQELVGIINANDDIVFVLAGGDMVCRTEEEFTSFRNITDYLVAPYFYGRGNHEPDAGYIGSFMVEEFFDVPFNMTTDSGWEQYPLSFDYGTHHFIFIDSPYLGQGSATINQTQLDWLTDDLASHQSSSTITIWMHHRSVSSDFFNTTAFTAFKDILNDHQDLYDNIIAVLSSHLHANSEFEENGIQYLTTLAMTQRYIPDSEEHMGYRIITIEDDALASWGVEELWDRPVTDPVPYSAEITNMEGCGNWVFAEEKYYEFLCKFQLGDEYQYYDFVKMRLVTSSGNITVYFDYQNDVWGIEEGSDYVTIKNGDYATRYIWLNATFHLYFKRSILDDLDVDIYMWANNTAGDHSDWEEEEADYFNIYNLGGQSVLSIGGDDDLAGLTVGGDVFELWAYSSETSDNWAMANVTYRKLQHFQTQLFVHAYTLETVGSIFVETEPVGDVMFGMDYCFEDVWYSGWHVNLSIVDISVSANSMWADVRLEWFYGEETIATKNNIIRLLWEGYPEASPYRQSERDGFSIFVDFWFNRINASTTIGGRISAEWFGISDVSPWWAFWGADWKPSMERITESTFFHDLEINGKVESCRSLDFMRMWTKVAANGDPGIYDLNITVKEIDIMEWQTTKGSMEGVETPSTIPTKVPTMPQSGFLAPIINAFKRAITNLDNYLGAGIMGSWSIFVAFLDTIFSFAGWPGGFSAITSWIRSFLTWMIDAIGYAASLLGSTFLLMTSWLTFAIGQFATIATGFITIFTTLQWIWTEANAGWLDLSSFVIPLLPIIPLALFIWLFSVRDIEGVIGRVKMLWDLLQTTIMFLIQIGGYAFDLVSKLINLIPVVE